eukprot:433216-Pelagomonas_calceolata.AAC.2
MRGRCSSRPHKDLGVKSRKMHTQHATQGLDDHLLRELLPTFNLDANMHLSECNADALKNRPSALCSRRAQASHTLVPAIPELVLCLCYIRELVAQCIISCLHLQAQGQARESFPGKPGSQEQRDALAAASVATTVL